MPSLSQPPESNLPKIDPEPRPSCSGLCRHPAKGHLQFSHAHRDSTYLPSHSTSWTSPHGPVLRDRKVSPGPRGLPSNGILFATGVMFKTLTMTGQIPECFCSALPHQPCASGAAFLMGGNLAATCSSASSNAEGPGLAESLFAHFAIALPMPQSCRRPTLA